MKSVLVWDFPTRLFHWLLVVAIAAAYISGDTGGNWMVWHGRIGILIVGLIAGILGGIVGTGTSIMLLPVLAYSFGPKQAVPIMAIAAIMANIARILAWWRDIDWRAVVVYSLPGIPAAALGAGTLLALPSGFVDIAIGAFFILMIPFRRWMHARHFTLPLWSLAAVHPEAKLIDGPALRQWRQRGLRVNAWTVDKPSEVAALAALGVEAIITNRPGAVRRQLTTR